MTAIDQLAAFYEDAETFTRHIDAHILHGYCYITPDQLALARPVCSRWSLPDLSNPCKIPALTEKADCWYVWAAIGDLEFLLSLIPYPLEMIAFARRRPDGFFREPKLYNFAKFHGRRQTTRSTKA